VGCRIREKVGGLQQRSFVVSVEGFRDYLPTGPTDIQLVVRMRAYLATEEGYLGWTGVSDPSDLILTELLIEKR
jgi:hypothetical protein